MCNSLLFLLPSLLTLQLLARSGSLRHLFAAACGIGDEGAVSIAHALAINRSLRTLDLRYVVDHRYVKHSYILLQYIRPKYLIVQYKFRIQHIRLQYIRPQYSALPLDLSTLPYIRHRLQYSSLDFRCIRLQYIRCQDIVLNFSHMGGRVVLHTWE